MSSIITAENLSFSYREHIVLNNLQLNVESGEYVSILGDNGSGKSTLIKLLLGELKADSGNITLFGESVESFSHWEHIGYLEQNAGNEVAGFPANVLEIVTANLYKEIGKFRLPNKAHKQKAKDALSKVEMLDYAYKQPSELSGGQLQRVMLARALVAEPKLIILDEPTNAMDSQSTKSLYEKLRELNSKGISLLIITHDISAAQEYSDCVLYLKDGKLVKEAHNV